MRYLQGLAVLFFAVFASAAPVANAHDEVERTDVLGASFARDGDIPKRTFDDSLIKRVTSGDAGLSSDGKRSKFAIDGFSNGDGKRFESDGFTNTDGKRSEFKTDGFTNGDGKRTESDGFTNTDGKRTELDGFTNTDGKRTESDGFTNTDGKRSEFKTDGFTNGDGKRGTVSDTGKKRSEQLDSVY